MCNFVVYIVDGVLGRPKINASFPTFIARMKLKDSLLILLIHFVIAMGYLED